MAAQGARTRVFAGAGTSHQFPCRLFQFAASVRSERTTGREMKQQEHSFSPAMKVEPLAEALAVELAGLVAPALAVGAA